jgi:hypothetical protein
MQDFAKTYREFSDDAIASMHGEIDTLTEDARLALLSEIEKRGIDEKNSPSYALSRSSTRQALIENGKNIEAQRLLEFSKGSQYDSLLESGEHS